VVVVVLVPGLLLTKIALLSIVKLWQILAANEKDMEEAKRSDVAGPLLKRLALSEGKIKTLAEGIISLAEVRALEDYYYYYYPQWWRDPLGIILLHHHSTYYPNIINQSRN